MNKEQIAFEKWALLGSEPYDLTKDRHGSYTNIDTWHAYTGWHGAIVPENRPHIDKQDSLEFMNAVSDLVGLLDESQLCPNISGKASVLKDFYSLLTKIRNHLTNKDLDLLEPTIFAGKLDINEVNKGWE